MCFCQLNEGLKIFPAVSSKVDASFLETSTSSRGQLNARLILIKRSVSGLTRRSCQTSQTAILSGRCRDSKGSWESDQSCDVQDVHSRCHSNHLLSVVVQKTKVSVKL